MPTFLLIANVYRVLQKNWALEIKVRFAVNSTECLYFNTHGQPWNVI